MDNVENVNEEDVESTEGSLLDKDDDKKGKGKK